MIELDEIKVTTENYDAVAGNKWFYKLSMQQNKLMFLWERSMICFTIVKFVIVSQYALESLLDQERLFQCQLLGMSFFM